MNIIIPIYPVNADEEELLDLDINQVPIAFSVVENLCHFSGANVHVFTTVDSSLDFSSYPGVHHHKQEKQDVSIGLFSHLPSGSYESVVCCSQSFEKDEIMVIVDYRNPCITPDLILKAFDTYLQDPEKTLVSVTVPEDNPVQFNAYYRLIDIDVVCLLDGNGYSMESLFSKNDGETLLVTRPGPFEWGSFDGLYDENRGIYIRRSRHKVGDAENEFVENDEDSIIYVKDGEGSARRVWAHSTGSELGTPTMAGMSLVHSFRTMPIAVVPMGHETFALYVSDDIFNEKNAELRLCPFPRTESKDINPDDLFIRLDETSCQDTFAWKGRTFHGPVHTFAWDGGVDGYMVSVVGQASGSHADFCEPLKIKDICMPSSDGLHRINSETGEVITGRQQFPLIYQLNSSLTIMSYGCLDHVAGHSYDNDLRAFILDERESQCILNMIDYQDMKSKKQNSEP